MLDPGQVYEDLYSKANESTSAYARYFQTAKSELDPRRQKNSQHTTNPQTTSKLLRQLAKKEPAYFALEKALGQVDLKPDSSILEIGSGLGYLTRALNAAGFKCHGIDISSTAVSNAREFFGSENYSCRSINEIDQSEAFDLVVATEVIEHVPEPLDLLRKSLSILKPGGYLIITTPNRSFFPSDMIWESSLPPVHHWWLTELSLETAARKLNAEISFIDFREFFTPKNALIWDTENLESNYQGAQEAPPKVRPESNRFLGWVRAALASNPWLVYFLAQLLRNIPQNRFLVAGQKCHTMGAVIKKA
jgi:2-polyprenyl-3-methyl-5-hydroxy-6-metoxy-1,4-benzoquinol methylase